MRPRRRSNSSPSRTWKTNRSWPVGWERTKWRRGRTFSMPPMYRRSNIRTVRPGPSVTCGVTRKTSAPFTKRPCWRPKRRMWPARATTPTPCSRPFAIRDAAVTMQLEWNQSEVIRIVATYFDHYLIDPAGAWLPASLFRNPLFVRMYCEAANPLRQDTVGVEALPTSLVGVFELYHDTVIQRLARDPARVPVRSEEH